MKFHVTRPLFGKGRRFSRQRNHQPPHPPAIEQLEGRILLSTVWGPQTSDLSSASGTSVDDQTAFPAATLVAGDSSFSSYSAYPSTAEVIAATVGNVYYVSNSGNDSSDGSADSPWESLRYAAKQVQPGDTVIVKPGEYLGFELLFRSGTPDKRITFHAEPGVHIYRWNDRTQDGINLEGSSYITIEGFRITGIPRAGIRSVINEGVIIRSNVTDQNGYWGIFGSFTQDIVVENNVTSRSSIEHGIYISNSSHNAVIRNNLVWGNATNGIHLNGTGTTIDNALVENNVIYDNGRNGGSAINGAGLRNSVVRNNLAYGNHASGISLYLSSSGRLPATNNLIVNNTIVQAADARWAVNINSGSTHNTLLNNIFYTDSTSSGSISITPDSLSGFVSDYNVVVADFDLVDIMGSATLAEWQSLTGQDAHSIVAAKEELFVDPASDDFQLNSTSPAIDAGTSSNAPPTDLLDAVRPAGAGVDIGAYEAGSGSGGSDGGGGTGDGGGDPFAPLKIDFGTGSSPVEAGYQRFTTAVKGANAYGWLNGTVTARDRGGSTALNRDFVFTADASFGVDLPNGTYDVTLTFGDEGYRHDQMAVALEGAAVDSVDSAAGEFVTKTYRVDVADGELTLVLHDLGGEDRNVVLNALEVIQVSASGEDPGTDPGSGSQTMQFDFGSGGTGTVEADYAEVMPATVYSATRGYGWMGSAMDGRDRGTSGALTRDFHFGHNGTFAVDLPDGTYSVQLMLGDANYNHDQVGVFLEGAQVDTVTTAAGEFKTGTYSVTVSDGQLTVTLTDLGGGDPNFTLNALVVTGAGLEEPTDPSGPADPTDPVDPTDPDAFQVEGVTAHGPTLGTIDRFRVTFNRAVDASSFTGSDVLELTGPQGSISPIAVNQVSDTTFDIVIPSQSSPGSYTLVFDAWIRDTSGNLIDQDGDGIGGQEPDDRYTFHYTLERVPGTQLFDFGPGQSPVAPDYTGVDANAGYDPATGYGWQGGKLSSRDRGASSDLNRDFVYTPDAVFAVDLPNGTYNVIVTMGDADYRHDLMAVSLEGQQVDTVSTANREFLSNTYHVSVTDGQLAIRFRDLGGSDPVVVVNALEIVPQQTETALLQSAGSLDGTVASDIDAVFLNSFENVLL